MKREKQSLLEIHIAVFLFGLAGLFGKLVSLPSPLIVLGRVFFAAVALILIMFGSSHDFKLKSRRDYLLLSVLGLILSIHWITFFKSIQVSTVAVGLLSYSTFPVFVTFIEPYFFKEKIRLPDVIIAVVTFLGVVLVIPRFEMGNAVTRGMLWGLMSGFTFAVLSTLNRRYVREYPSVVIAFYQDAAATIFLFPFLFLVEFTPHTRDILLLVVLGVFCTAIAHSLFIKGMERVKAQLASIIASLEPVYGIVFAVLLLQEIPPVRTVIGGMVILGAAFFATINSSRPLAVPASSE